MRTVMRTVRTVMRTVPFFTRSRVLSTSCNRFYVMRFAPETNVQAPIQVSLLQVSLLPR